MLRVLSVILRRHGRRVVMVVMMMAMVGRSHNSFILGRLASLRQARSTDCRRIASNDSPRRSLSKIALPAAITDSTDPPRSTLISRSTVANLWDTVAANLHDPRQRLKLSIVVAVSEETI